MHRNLLAVVLLLFIMGFVMSTIAHPIPPSPATSALLRRAKSGSDNKTKPVASGSKTRSKGKSTGNSSGSEYEEPLKPGSLPPRPAAPPRRQKAGSKPAPSYIVESGSSESQAGVSKSPSPPPPQRPASPAVPADQPKAAPPRPPTPLADGPGSYAVMSPRNRFLIYDSKYDAYLLYFKFGDTTQMNRDRAYSTHDPSVLFKNRKDEVPDQGKEMEQKILLPLVERFKHSGIVQHVGTTTTGSEYNSEWYEIYLGKNKITALRRKAEFVKLLRLYGDETGQPWTHGGLSQEDFIEKFLALFDMASDTPVEHSELIIDETAKPITEMRNWRKYSNMSEEEE